MSAAAVSPWLAIVGVGEDGVEGLSVRAQRLVRAAVLVVGGARHLALTEALIGGERMVWPSPISAAYPAILARRGAAVAVLASGDPFCHGVGAVLADLVAPDEMVCVPVPGALSLACSRLVWPLHETSAISLCGHPIQMLLPLLQPGRRVLVLSADETTPGRVLAMLREYGFGGSVVHVLEHLGGPAERRRRLRADAVPPNDIARLNMLAIEVNADPGARVLPLTAGLPDRLFEHDGQLTKREVRAVTLAALAPLRGEHLWDIGTGNGSVAIEWMLRDPANRATGIDPRPDRLARAARNALALGVPGLDLREGTAPGALAGLSPPHAVFIGGGTRHDGLMEAAWRALPQGGRMVANSITIETDARLFAARESFGGTLTRLSVERLDGVGDMHGFRPAMTVTQWAASKP